MIARILLVITVLCTVLPLSAAQRFQATLEQSRWSVQASPVRCTLRHEIPRYGEGRFVHSAGGELAFEMNVLDVPVRDGIARLMSMPPFWKEAVQPKELGQLTLSAGATPFYATRDLALRMLYELDAGMLPTLYYRDFADKTDVVVVSLSSANFHDQLPEFRRCVSQLLPQGVDQLKDTAVHFDENQYKLSADAKQKLDLLAAYAADNRNIHFNIHGHADELGSYHYNQLLSERRSESVKKYLLSKGVTPAQIMQQASGERQPVASNRTFEGRSQNRRVTVAVVRLR